MGRYDGEDYGERPACKPGEHAWMMNGKCWKCHRDVATTYLSANPSHQRDRDEGRTRFKPPAVDSSDRFTINRCPLCHEAVSGEAHIDPYGFCWHKECYDEEASIKSSDD